ncbi:MAG TPA: hypothetical protein VGX76_21215, partial [Pirellulales bacterium]|nr:hypothetical protein [Pirellulales bacterium]
MSRAATLVAGILLPQAWLFGPSLAGQKVLLPLDVLANRNTYLPGTPENREMSARAALPVASDLVLNHEPFRRFVASELHARRLPFWDPYCYAGAPCVWGFLSPFDWIYFAWQSPRSLAWVQVAQSLLAATGAYHFFRRVSAVSFWPATIGAWCYPLTGFFVVWTGFRLGLAACWLPAVLLATDAVCRRPAGWAVPGLAALTTLTIVSGAIDVAGQVLFTSGLYAIWRLAAGWWSKSAAPRVVVQIAALAAAWVLGFVLAAPHLLPLAAYIRTGSRMLDRAGGSAERPPVGAEALPQTVLPNYYGTHGPDSLYLLVGNQLESAAGAYAGLLAACVLAPLAWLSPKHRSSNGFWLVLAFLGLSWLLNVPGLVAVWRLPGLNMMS